MSVTEKVSPELEALKRAHAVILRAFDYVAGLDNNDQEEVDYLADEEMAIRGAISKAEGRDK